MVPSETAGAPTAPPARIFLVANGTRVREVKVLAEASTAH